jgi:hypothetical protein
LKTVNTDEETDDPDELVGRSTTSVPADQDDVTGVTTAAALRLPNPYNRQLSVATVTEGSA